MKNPRAMGWVAGIVEGEGCCSINSGSPVLEVSMVDRDVVERFASLTGASVYFRKARLKYERTHPRDRTQVNAA